jgi:hypothetical protein
MVLCIFSERGGLAAVMAGLKIIAALAILSGVVILSLSTGQPNVQDMPSDTVEVKGRGGSQT